MAPAERSYASATDILAVLPHRSPFLFIDRVESFEVGHRIRAIKHVTRIDVCGDGAAPRLPPVYLLECFAQAGVLLVAAERRLGAGRLDVFLGTVDAFESSGDAVCDDAVYVEVCIEKRTSNLAILQGLARVRGALVAQARFTACFRWENSTQKSAEALIENPTM